MYIKEIKINGFKSFADNVNLELNRNFTGIVGPNGSGKSNIVDALKWVMGEQSVKTLRGSNGMTDVIFNGSASRDASRSAKVAIVLDNTDKSIPLDYTEIEIKRVVYKTGENEYFINNEKVRLKDITDLFVDTFSSKESLSIIPQGKISEIVNGRPEDKRLVIEEAASVVKYKKRKEEAIRKHAKTNENVERVNMIINELEVQISPLEEQATKAKKYKEAKEKLESVEIGLLATDISSMNEEYTLVKEEKENLQNKAVSLSSSDSKERSELESKKLERTRLDEEISSLQKELLNKSEEVNKLNSKKELLKERSKYDKETDEVKQSINRLKEEKLSLENEKITLESKYNNELEAFNKGKETLSKLNEELVSANSRVNNYTREVRELNKNKMDFQNRKDILEYNIENMTKVPFAVKTVINNPTLKGIVGRIGSLFNVENEYALAVDTALGASVNNVVTRTDNDAKEAINYLKRSGKGRCTFFPINLIKAKGIDSETLNVVKEMKGYVNIASSLVTYDKEYYSIITNQLGNIIVATNIDDALNISKKINSKYRVVTLDGEIVHVGGSLTGGSKNNNSSINEKTELDNIISQIKLCDINIEERESALKEANSTVDILTNKIYNANLELLNLNEKYTVSKKALDELLLKLENTSNELNALVSDKKEEKSELDNIMNAFFEAEKVKNELEIKMSEAESKRKNLVEEIEQMESTLSKTSSKVKEIEEKINSLALKETRLSTNLDNMLNRLNEDYNMTYEHARNNYELTMDIDEARNVIAENRRVIKSLGEVNLGSVDEYERVSKRFNFLNTQKEDLIAAQNNLLGIIRDMDDVMIDKFATTFKKVNIEFTKVFKNLFGGGDARLELTDPTNMLETGVEIKAYPPGKRPGALSLLSGGEMTLTAISLLFAIMNLKNVPFVILDEVESALDEVNVEKFGKYINTYKGKTQLLVITHKKKTMEYLDLLYGITMQESGVSKLVSVKLEEIK